MFQLSPKTIIADVVLSCLPLILWYDMIFFFFCFLSFCFLANDMKVIWNVAGIEISVVLLNLYTILSLARCCWRNPSIWDQHPSCGYSATIINILNSNVISNVELTIIVIPVIISLTPSRVGQSLWNMNHRWRCIVVTSIQFSFPRSNIMICLSFRNIRNNPRFWE